MTTIQEPEDVTVRLCELVEDVARDHLGFSVPTDCFCGRGGFWRDGVKPASWVHDDAAVRYIEETVRARLAVERKLKPLRRRLALLRKALSP